MLILPKDDDPALITMPFEVAQAVECAWISRDRFEVSRALTDRVEFLAGLLKKNGFEFARFGTEMVSEQYLGTS